METWHAEIASWVLRLYEGKCGYARGVSFVGVAFVKTLGRHDVFIEGALRMDGHEMSVQNWRDLARKLRDDYGTTTIHSVRHGKPRQYDILRLTT
jgi:hypothetical protein